MPNKNNAKPNQQKETTANQTKQTKQNQKQQQGEKGPSPQLWDNGFASSERLVWREIKQKNKEHNVNRHTGDVRRRKKMDWYGEKNEKRHTRDM